MRIHHSDRTHYLDLTVQGQCQFFCSEYQSCAPHACGMPSGSRRHKRNMRSSNVGVLIIRRKRSSRECFHNPWYKSTFCWIIYWKLVVTFPADVWIYHTVGTAAERKPKCIDLPTILQGGFGFTLVAYRGKGVLCVQRIITYCTFVHQITPFYFLPPAITFVTFSNVGCGSTELEVKLQGKSLRVQASHPHTKRLWLHICCWHRQISSFLFKHVIVYMCDTVVCIKAPHPFCNSCHYIK